MSVKHPSIWSIVLSASLLLAGGVSAQPEPLTTQEPGFIRIVHDGADQPRALEVAVVRYLPASGKPAGHYVDLIGAVHIADKDYYQQLNNRFRDYDAVLFELVTSSSENLPGTGEAGFNMLSMFQGWMKNVLDLSFQLEQIDYGSDNLVHADMTTSEFQASMQARGESMFKTFARMWRAGLQQSLQSPPSDSDLDIFRALFAANREQALKQVMAREFINMEQLEAVLSKGDGSTLLTERNKKALQVLSGEIDSGKQRLAIFYGAAHMPDMGRRLMAEFELVPATITWLQAWDLTE